MVPQAATKALVEHMLSQHGRRDFASYIACQMTGTSIERLSSRFGEVKLEAAATQLEGASQGDNKLFTEEKQNLWIDEVQDASIWCEAFRKLSPEILESNDANALDDNLIRILMVWVADSAKLLNKASQKDGAIGWTSKPEVFAVLFRVIKCINAFLNHLDAKVLAKKLRSPSSKDTAASAFPGLTGIVEDLETFARTAIDYNFHPVLVQTLLEREPLASIITRSKHASLVGKLSFVKDPKFPIALNAQS